MFDSIGKKIKSLAKIISYVGIILSIYFGVNLLLHDRKDLGIFVLVFGSLASWLNSFVLYGFGELVDNSAIIAGKKTLEEARTEESRNTNSTWVCRNCDTLNPGNSPTCIKCGKPRNGGSGMGSHRSDEDGKSYWGDDKWRSRSKQNDDDK